MIIARYYLGLIPRKVKTYLGPVYGDGPDVIARVACDNPADLLESTDLRPGELAIYANYAGRDQYNFDAQTESFAWLAARRGVAVDLDRSPGATTTCATSSKPSRPRTSGSAATSCRPPRVDSMPNAARRSRFSRSSPGLRPLPWLLAGSPWMHRRVEWRPRCQPRQTTTRPMHLPGPIISGPRSFPTPFYDCLRASQLARPPGPLIIFPAIPLLTGWSNFDVTAKSPGRKSGASRPIEQLRT